MDINKAVSSSSSGVGDGFDIMFLIILIKIKRTKLQIIKKLKRMKEIDINIDFLQFNMLLIVHRFIT